MKHFIGKIVTISLFFSLQVHATDWPKRPIKLTVGYGAGGTTDSTARVLASLLEEELGTKITVLNKPGGGGSVAAALAKTQKPDGYSLFTFTTGAAVISPHMQNLTYDTLNDFTFVSQYAQWSLGLVAHQNAPYDTLEELIAYTREHPGKISYAFGGTGTPQHLSMLQLAQIEGMDWKAIPFKGGAAAVTALLGEHVDLMVGATEWLPQVKSGEFKLLAILTDKRMADFPDVPTLLDLGYELPAAAFLGIAGPKGIPQEVVNKLEVAIEKVSQQPKMVEIINKLAMQSQFRNSKEYEAYVKSLYETQGEIVRAANLAK